MAGTNKVDRLDGVEGRRDRTMREVAIELDGGRGTQAVRRFMQGIHQRLFPSDGELVKWLIQTEGKDRFSRLIHAFARHPCFYCSEGRDVCKECNGKRQLENHVLCAWCLGLGGTRCDFCDGSGWVTINWVPSALRLAVIVQRAALAKERMEGLLKEPLPGLSGEKIGTLLNQYGHALLETDKVMGCFENILVASGGHAHLPSPAEAVLAKALECGIHLSLQGTDRIRRILHAMSILARDHARTVTKPAVRDLALNAAELYDRLSHRRDLLAGTSMEHPFLQKTLSESGKASEEASP